MFKHKHHDVICAWARGEQIQNYVESSQKWVDWTSALGPSWYSHIEYRVKPKEKVYDCFTLWHSTVRPCPEWFHQGCSNNLRLTYVDGKLTKAEVLE